MRRAFWRWMYCTRWRKNCSIVPICDWQSNIKLSFAVIRDVYVVNNGKRDWDSMTRTDLWNSPLQSLRTWWYTLICGHWCYRQRRKETVGYVLESRKGSRNHPWLLNWDIVLQKRISISSGKRSGDEAFGDLADQGALVSMTIFPDKVIREWFHGAHGQTICTCGVYPKVANA